MNTITFISKRKFGDQEKEDAENIIDEEIKDEIKTKHGSVLDLYLASLNIKTI